jgi:hypothetical protein
MPRFQVSIRSENTSGFLDLEQGRVEQIWLESTQKLAQPEAEPNARIIGPADLHSKGELFDDGNHLSNLRLIERRFPLLAMLLVV